MSNPIVARVLALVLAGILFVVGAQAEAGAVEIKVVSSGGFAAAFRELVPEFERTTGNKVVAEWGPSMGNTPEAIPQRLARGEPIDVVIMVGDALGELAKRGQFPESVADHDHDVDGLAACKPLRDGLGRVSHRWAPLPLTTLFPVVRSNSGTSSRSAAAKPPELTTLISTAPASACAPTTNRIPARTSASTRADNRIDMPSNSLRDKHRSLYRFG